MQTWADYLDGLKAGAKVIPLKQQAEKQLRTDEPTDL